MRFLDFSGQILMNQMNFCVIFQQLVPYVHVGMKDFLRSLLLICCLSFVQIVNGDEAPTLLFDGKTFQGWYLFIQEKDKDPAKVFTIEDRCLHISGEKFGYLSTEKEYTNYELRLSYKWGDKKWPPREQVVRDSGIIYHAQGEDTVWCNGLELQIQEGDTGDLWLIPGKQEKPTVTLKGVPFGEKKEERRAVKWSTHEKPHGEWNEVLLVVKGKHFEHWVNGVKVMEGESMDREKGKIQLQSEGAEVWYRDISLVNITE